MREVTAGKTGAEKTVSAGAETTTMQEYLVCLEVEIPVWVSPSEVQHLRRRDRESLTALAAQGSLQRVWGVRGRSATWGVWHARNAAELDAMLATLPLRSFTEITVHETDAHPSDPGAPRGCPRSPSALQSATER